MPFLSLFNKKPVEFTFDQMDVLKNMEIYLRRKGDEDKDPVSKKSRYELADKLQKTEGFCHGFSLYFLDAIVKDVKDKNANHLHYHFNDLQIISAWNPKNKLDESLDAVFERVISHVNWLQDPKPYYSSAKQSDVELLMEGEFIRDRCYYDVFDSLKSFTQFLRTHVPADRPILIESSNHATALYRDGDTFYCRDPNDPLGLRKINFKDIDEVAAFYYEQLKQIYPKTDPFNLPIKFTICRTLEQESCGLETYEDYVSEKLKNDPNFIHRKAPDGATALWQAFINGDKAAVNLLLKEGADPNACREKDKLSIFEYALATNQLDVVAAVMASPKFDYNFKDYDGVTPLMLAVRKENTKIINELLNPAKKNNINAITKEGETALHIALKKNNVALVGKLLSRGADILAKTANSKSPLETLLDKCLAEKQVNDIAMLELLLTASPTKVEISGACLEYLLAHKELLSERKPEIAYLLMDKHASSDLFLSIDAFLTVPQTQKPIAKTKWTSMFQKSPEENDVIFSKMLRHKINHQDVDINSPKELNALVLNVMADCAKQNLNFSHEFQARLHFTMNYLQHREIKEQFQINSLETPTPKS